MNAITQTALIGGIALIGAAATFRVAGPPRRDVPCNPAELKEHEICLATVMERWQGKVLWVDARPRKEWQADGMSGSVLWNLDPAEDANAFEAELMQHLADEPVVIVYCGEGNCGVSSQVATKILQLGMTDEVHALHGGVGALRAVGLVKGSN